MIDVIFINSLPDTQEFLPMFEGLDANVLINPSRGRIRSMLNSNLERPLLISGHGTEMGLLTKDFKGYIIDSGMVDMLRRRTIIGCWCYAGNFADHYGLHGFFTSMFISNINEATELGFTTDAETITNENTWFSNRIHRFLEEGTPMSQWLDILHSECHWDIPFVRYNYEAMAYYE